MRSSGAAPLGSTRFLAPSLLNLKDFWRDGRVGPRGKGANRSNYVLHVRRFPLPSS
jgi:hypothetical protein